MRLRLHLIAAAIVAATATSDDGRAVAATSAKTLVLKGTVTSIKTVDHEVTPWLVTMRVRKVISGEFAGSTFQFAVHSPARAGQNEGSSYTIEAVWKEGGYTVDEMQWRRQKRPRTASPSTESV